MQAFHMYVTPATSSQKKDRAKGNIKKTIEFHMHMHVKTSKEYPASRRMRPIAIS